MTLVIHTLATSIARMIASVANIVSKLLQAIAEAKAHNAELEADLYRGRYRHISKADDDLPIVR